MIDANMSMIQVRNAINVSVIMSKNVRLRRVADYTKEDCYAANSIDAHLAVEISWKQRAVKIIITALVALSSARFVISEISDQNVEAFTTLSVESVIERVMSNDIIIYNRSFSETNVLQLTTDNFSLIWRNTDDIVNISESEWMLINILLEAKSDAFKVYSLSLEDRDLVNKKFDELHAQDKINWTNRSTSYEYSVFVVWRIVHLSEKSLLRKNRVVVDIRDLNKISKSDVYLMLLQANITFAMQNCEYISIMNCVNFFHQWSVTRANRHKLTVVSHCDSEQWNVVVMSYKNSFAYVQRQINHLLRNFREFARVYIDNIVMFSHTLDDHIRHLYQVFKLFENWNIEIKSSKTYLDYSSVTLLDQKVNSFDLSIVFEKLKAISQLKFSLTLKDLKSYLDLTRWLRNYILYYAQLIELLQRRKTLMLRDASSKRKTRKIFSRDSRLNIFLKEETARFQRSAENIQLFNLSCSS